MNNKNILNIGIFKFDFFQKKKERKRFTIRNLKEHFIYIHNLVAKAPGLNIGKKLRNLLSNS